MHMHRHMWLGQELFGRRALTVFPQRERFISALMDIYLLLKRNLTRYELRSVTIVNVTGCCTTRPLTMRAGVLKARNVMLLDQSKVLRLQSERLITPCACLTARARQATDNLVGLTDGIGLCRVSVVNLSYLSCICRLRVPRVLNHSCSPIYTSNHYDSGTWY